MPTRFSLTIITMIILTASARTEEQSFPLTLDSLSKRSWSELECLYRQGTAEALPDGYYRGKTVFCKDKPLWRARTGITRILWKGKHITGCRMVNQWAGVKVIESEVKFQESWLDGKPSVILDYRSTSKVWRNVRDEIRLVAPGICVGIMHEVKDCERTIRAFFVLEAQCCKP